VKAAFKILNF